MSLEETLKQFREEVPTLGLLGEHHFIFSEKPYSLDDDVQLICKYLQAYKKGKIDRFYQDGEGNYEVGLACTSKGWTSSVI